LSNYTKHNLKDGEDSFTASDSIEARFGRKHLDSTELGVSYFRYGPNHKSPNGHYHHEQEEAYVVISGSGKLRVDDDVIDLQPFDVVRVAPAGVRGVEGGPEGIEIIAIGGHKPEGGDGELVKDRWTD
jgi:uncharacterized cupin superfamily protein